MAGNKLREQITASILCTGHNRLSWLTVTNPMTFVGRFGRPVGFEPASPPKARTPPASLQVFPDLPLCDLRRTTAHDVRRVLDGHVQQVRVLCDRGAARHCRGDEKSCK